MIERGGYNEVDYYADQEMAALCRMLGKITDAVKAKNQGRNQGCWPVLSFGWKDADLEPEGCTGIKDITIKDEDTLYVEVGGHKTFCYDSEADEDKSQAEGLFLADACSGYSCDGDTESFTAGFHEVLTVPIVFNKAALDLSIPKTVNRIIKAAEKRCNDFHKEMAAISSDFEKVGQP